MCIADPFLSHPRLSSSLLHAMVTCTPARPARRPSRPVDKEKAEQELSQNVKKAVTAEEVAPKAKHVRSMSFLPVCTHLLLVVVAVIDWLSVTSHTKSMQLVCPQAVLLPDTDLVDLPFFRLCQNVSSTLGITTPPCQSTIRFAYYPSSPTRS